VSGMATVSALGYYVLHCNGARVSLNRLDPGRSNSKRCFSTGEKKNPTPQVLVIITITIIIATAPQSLTLWQTSLSSLMPAEYHHYCPTESKNAASIAVFTHALCAPTPN